jgi:hypothetical protein
MPYQLWQYNDLSYVFIHHLAGLASWCVVDHLTALLRQAGFSIVLCVCSECFIRTFFCLSERYKAQMSKSEDRTVLFFVT